jgi:hypothetical protein
MIERPITPFPSDALDVPPVTPVPSDTQVTNVPITPTSTPISSPVTKIPDVPTLPEITLEVPEAHEASKEIETIPETPKEPKMPEAKLSLSEALKMPAEDPIDPLVKEIYELVKSSFNQEINANTIALLVPSVIYVIEKNTKDKNIDGAYKKSIALSVIKLIVKEVDMDPETKAYVEQFVNLTAPTVIDTMIKIANHEINLGKYIEIIQTSRCFCF